MTSRLLLAALATSVAMPAYAQTESADAQSDEIVVTAQRRAENLQDVPVAVTAVTAEILEARGASNLLEFQKVAPSLTVQNTASNVSPFIRGVGTTVTGAGQSASVATYIDGVYVATLTAAAFDLDNVEQVQLLAGPQGALYGRNATGGAIVITTRTPKGGDALSGRLRAEYGNYDSVVLSGGVARGLSDTIGFSLNGSYRRRDGFVRNLNPAGFGTHQQDLNDRDAWSASGALSLAASERFDIVLRGSHFQSRDRFGVGLQAVGLDLNVLGTGLNGSQLYYAGVLQGFGVPAAGAAAAASQLRFSDRFSATYDNQANGFSRGVLPGKDEPGSFVALNVDTVSLNFSYAADAFEIKSTSSYTNAKSLASTEIILADPRTYPSGFGGGAVGFSGNFPSRNYQQDVQVASVDSDVKWIVGAFYLDNRGRTALSGDVPVLSALTALNTWTNNSTALYGQVTVPLTDTLRVTGGARYTWERYRIEDRLTLTNPLNIFGVPNAGTRRNNSSEPTFTARLEYDDGPLLLYVGVATGFKGATLSPVNPFSPGVDPEKITSYEGGLKWTVAPGVRLNGALFHYDYRNIHIAYTDSALGGANILVNGTGAKLTGFEWEVSARANEWLTFRTSGLLLRSRYNRDVQTVGSIAVLRTDGNRLAGAPKFVLNAGVDAAIPVAAGKLQATADVSHSAGYWFDAENLIGTGGATASAFTTIDASLTWRPDGERWEIGLFGRNLFDEKYFQSGLSASGILRSALAASPQQYGVRVGLDF